MLDAPRLAAYFVKGTVFAKVRPHAPELLGDLGRFLARWMPRCIPSRIRRAPGVEVGLHARGWIKNYVHTSLTARAAPSSKIPRLYDSDVVPALPQLRRSVIYGDANDYNVLVNDPGRSRARSPA